LNYLINAAGKGPKWYVWGRCRPQFTTLLIIWDARLFSSYCLGSWIPALDPGTAKDLGSLPWIQGLPWIWALPWILDPCLVSRYCCGSWISTLDPGTALNLVIALDTGSLPLEHSMWIFRSNILTSTPLSLKSIVCFCCREFD
jgi:hypothetical protein